MNHLAFTPVLTTITGMQNFHKWSRHLFKIKGRKFRFNGQEFMAYIDQKHFHDLFFIKHGLVYVLLTYEPPPNLDPIYRFDE